MCLPAIRADVGSVSKTLPWLTGRLPAIKPRVGAYADSAGRVPSVHQGEVVRDARQVSGGVYQDTDENVRGLPTTPPSVAISAA